MADDKEEGGGEIRLMTTTGFQLPSSEGSIERATVMPRLWKMSLVLHRRWRKWQWKSLWLTSFNLELRQRERGSWVLR